MAFSCTDSGWTWPGVAQYLPMLAPRLAPGISLASLTFGPTERSIDPEIGLTTQRDGRIRGERTPTRLIACAAELGEAGYRADWVYLC